MTVTLCPKCGGQKHVSKPPWVPGDQAEWMGAGTETYPCTVCGGTGLVDVYTPSEPVPMCTHPGEREIEAAIHLRDRAAIGLRACEDELDALRVDHDRLHANYVRVSSALNAVIARKNRLRAALRKIDDFTLGMSSADTERKMREIAEAALAADTPS